MSFRSPAARPLRIRSSHRPSPFVPGSLKLRGISLGRPGSCQGSLLLAVRQQQRRRQRLIEALATALATSFVTSLALAQPALLHDAPSTSWQRITAPLQAGAGSAPLIDCP